MNITLKPQTDKIVAEKILSGRFQTADEVIEEAVYALDEMDRERAVELKRFQLMIEEATASLDRGEFVDGDETFATIREMSRLRRLNAA